VADAAIPDLRSGSGGSIAEQFSRGESIAVEVDEIERALADLWKEASRARGDGAEGAVSRAALWNIVIPTRAQGLGRIRQLVDELAPLLPARAITLVQEPEVSGTDEGVRATIESNVVSRPSGARVVYSEEITLRARGGVDAAARFGAVVRALQIPGLPTATIWADPTIAEGLLRRQLLPASDRLIVDTGQCARPAQLLEVRRSMDLAGAIPVADLGWLRLANFRLLFAGLFDPPVGGAPLQLARRVTIRHRPGAEVSALLLAAWLAVMLDWMLMTADPGDAGHLRFRFDRADKAGGGHVDVGLVAAPGECGTSGIVGLELCAASSTGEEELYAVCRTEENHATLTLPIAPPRVVKLDSRRDAELCLAALGPAGRDPLFARCLSLAARLATFAPGA
jgi:glucose-6-phosphate dehydrogenase assembly protein OpcA